MKLQRRHFKGLRALAIAAIILTAILLTFILVESGTEGAISAQVTQIFSKPMAEAVGENNYIADLAPQKINIDCNTVYYGIPAPLKISVEPARANPAYTYEFYDLHGQPVEDISIDENNNIISKIHSHPGYGVTLKITSTLNPNAGDSIAVNVNTLDPNDHRIDKIEPYFTDGWLSTIPTEDSYLKVGKQYYHYIGATVKDEYLDELGLTPDNNRIIISVYNKVPEINGEKFNRGSYHQTEKLLFGNSVCFYQEGSYDVTYKLGSVLGEPVTVNMKHAGIVDPDFEYVPSEIALQEEEYERTRLKLIDGEYVLTFEKGGTSQNINSANQNNPYRNANVILDYYDDHSRECLTIENLTIKRKTNRGECYLWVKSAVAPEDESLWLKIKVIFKGDEPTSLTVIKKNAYMYNKSYTHSVLINGAHAGGFYDEGEVRVRVIEGENKVKSIEGNTIIFKSIGKATLRIESVANPELYEEFTINIGLYDSMYYFVRKILGHALMYLLLGFGFAGIYFLLIKPRWLCAIAAPITVFGIAVFSEWLQSRMPGRTASWSDITLDSISGAIGLLAAAVLVTAVCLIWHKAKRESFSALIDAFRHLSFLTLFKKSDKIFFAEEAVDDSATEEAADAYSNNITN